MMKIHTLAIQKLLRRCVHWSCTKRMGKPAGNSGKELCARNCSPHEHSESCRTHADGNLFGIEPFWRCCVLTYRKRFLTWGLRECKELAIREFVSKLVIPGKHSRTAECFLFFCTVQTSKAFSFRSSHVPVHQIQPRSQGPQAASPYGHLTTP